MAELGFWERKGKSPALGALIGVTLIAALYSLAGNVLISAYMLGDMGRLGQADWNELRHGIMDRYRDPILALTTVFEFLFFGAGTYLLFRRWHALPLRKSFRLALPSPAALPSALVGAAGLFPLAMLAGEVFERIFPFLRDLEGQGSSLLTASSPGSWALLVASICVTPALCEEFLFRGYFQGTLGRVVKSPWSWLITGTFFALVHQNYIGLGALLVIGIYLAYVFDSGGSIWPGMLVHFLYNGGVVLLANGRLRLPWAFDADGLVRPIVAVAALPIAAAGVASLAIIKRRRLSADAKEDSRLHALL
jgi:membrane protease YdiL (CAAX protease family)